MLKCFFVYRISLYFSFSHFPHRIQFKSRLLPSTQNMTYGRRKAHSVFKEGCPTSSAPAGIDGKLKDCKNQRKPRSIVRWLSCLPRSLLLCKPPQKHQAAKSELWWTIFKNGFFVCLFFQSHGMFFPGLAPHPFLSLKPRWGGKANALEHQGVTTRGTITPNNWHRKNRITTSAAAFLWHFPIF